MLHEVQISHKVGLANYAGRADLRAHVHELEAVARSCAPKLAGRTVWMINSTAQGGGVAEMLPKLVGLMRELGVTIRWLVMQSDRPEFFPFTKRLHNLIHGAGDAAIDAAERQLYEDVSRRAAEALAARVAPGDCVIVHDPQPAAAGAFLSQRVAIGSVWNCHIGADRSSPQSQAAWDFLAPYVTRYQRAVFSAPEYIPRCLAGVACIIPPAIDPFSHKNRALPPVKLMGIACNADLVREHAPVLTPPFAARALRLQPDGSLAPAHAHEEIGLLYRPTVVQVSRWDRLKGFDPLLRGFCAMKRRAHENQRGLDHRQRRRLEIVRLVLAGPDPHGVNDDPEAADVWRELGAAYQELTPALKRDVALLVLPMTSVKHNALMVNVLQRAASVAVQNSLQEGFGLVVAEAAWKGTPVVGSSACGIRHQIRDGVDGWLIADASDPEAVCQTLLSALSNPHERERRAHSAQLRTHEHFLVFAQVRRWLELLAELAGM